MYFLHIWSCPRTAKLKEAHPGGNEAQAVVLEHEGGEAAAVETFKLWVRVSGDFPGIPKNTQQQIEPIEKHSGNAVNVGRLPEKFPETRADRMALDDKTRVHR